MDNIISRSFNSRKLAIFLCFYEFFCNTFFFFFILAENFKFNVTSAHNLLPTKLVICYDWSNFFIRKSVLKKKNHYICRIAQNLNKNEELNLPIRIYKLNSYLSQQTLLHTIKIIFQFLKVLLKCGFSTIDLLISDLFNGVIE